MPTILAAAALGALTGYLVGLTTSSVVGPVLSALLAMAAGVAALTGVQNPFLPKGEGAAERGRIHNFAVFGFAAAAVVGVSAGLWIRSHNLLSPQPAAIQAQWQALGFERETAAQIALISLTGIKLDDSGAAAPPEGGKTTAASYLFAETATDTCQRTNPATAPDADEARNAWKLSPGRWPQFAEAMPDTDKAGLQAFWQSFCAGGSQ